MQRPKFIAEWGNPTDEDNQAGRTHCVRYRQNWHEGAYLADVASRCTEADAKLIAEALNEYPEACRLLASISADCRVRRDEIQEFLSTKEV